MIKLKKEYATIQQYNTMSKLKFELTVINDTASDTIHGINF